MGYVIVVAVSLLVGAAVYSVTLRRGREADPTFGFGDERDPDADGGPGPGYTYLRVATTGPSWRDRILGLVALVVLMIITAAVLALGVYQLGHLINLTIERFIRQ